MPTKAQNKISREKSLLEVFTSPRKQKIIVVLPALNAEKTLEKTVNDISRDIVDEIILVDDGSQDQTVAIAKRLNLSGYSHNRNMGYGANQKTCYTLALEKGADIIIMIHPDYQYDPKVIKYLVGMIEDGYADVMLGSRIRSLKEAINGGMPVYKYFGNRFLTAIENFLGGYNLSEWHTGMRAFKREVLENIDFIHNKNDFSFDSQILFQIVEKGYRIGEIPVPVKYFDGASSIDFLNSAKYGLATVGIALKFFVKRILREIFLTK